MLGMKRVTEKLEKKAGELQEKQKLMRDDTAAVDLAGVAIMVTTALVALLACVIICGNLETATQGTVCSTSSWYTLLGTISTYGSTSVGILSIGLIVMAAFALIYIFR